jgi:hypothetical protein
MTTINMRGVMLLAGLFFIVLSMAANVMLYGSFSDDPFYKTTYISMGLGFDLTKAFLLIITMLLWVSGLFVLAVFAGLFWCVLTLISVAAGFGFMSVVQSQAESAAVLASARYQSAKAAVSNAEKSVASLSEYADKGQALSAQAKIDEFSAQLTALLNGPARNSIGQRTGKTVTTQLDQGCPGSSWYHRKYCPEIQQLESEMGKHQSVIEGHQRYEAARVHKDQMLLELTNLDVGTVGATSHLHPMFIGLSKLSGQQADTLKFIFLLVSSLTCELLGSLCLLIYSRLSTGQGRVFEGMATQSDYVKNTNAVPNAHKNLQANQVTSKGTLSVEDETLYQKLKTGVCEQKITNLSFKTLSKTLGIRDNRLITALRDRLVAEGLAMYDDTRKCLPIAR